MRKEASNNMLEENHDSFIYPPYFEIYQKYQKLDEILETLHYAKITNEKLPDEILGNCIFTISEFVDTFNKNYSEVAETKIKLFISSHKWKI